MKKVKDFKWNRKYLLLFLLVMFMASSIALIQYQQESSIVGTWVSQSDQNSKWIFTKNGKAKWYYEEKLNYTYTYRLSTTSPQCGKQVQTGPHLEFLELTDVDNGFQQCYYINTLDDEHLSLSPFGRANILVFDRQ